MSYYLSGYDSDVTARMMQWARRLWGKAYAPDFMCADPWVDLFNIVYHRNLPPQARLANWWYTRGSNMPLARDPLCFRFQQELDQVSPERPDGITHVELVVTRNYGNETGICLGVGVPAGATPLNGTFGLHPFAPGLAGDGWFDPSANYAIHYRFIDVESI